MAETTYFYDGTTGGDATNAPYDESEFSDYFYNIISGREGFVIPEYLDNLDINNGGNGQIIVSAGAAAFGGLYINDSNTILNVDSSAANNRVDAVVLTRSEAANTIRLAIVKGVEALYPANPALSADQMLLAHVWIASGYNAATTPVPASHIYDRRHFMHIGPNALKYVGRDFMPNGEFMLCSSTAASSPDYWREIGTLTSGTNSSPALGESVRGATISLSCDAAEGIATTVMVPKIVNSGTRTFTIKGTIKCLNQPIDVSVSARTLGGATAGTVTQRFYLRSAGGTSQEFVFRYNLDYTYDALDISFIAPNAGSGWHIGQIMLIDGWVDGPFRQKSEWLFSDMSIADAAWSLTAKSDSTTTINLNASFGTSVMRSLRAIIARIRGRDSGSAAAGPFYMELEHYNKPTLTYGRVYCDYIPADTQRENFTLCPIDYNNANMPFDVKVEASGAGTFDAQIILNGIIT